ncbi:MAG: NAD(P)/FAD-dependent oxidoreductase [Vicinamibacterales bacterium]
MHPDVVIVGAGPAGALAATALARSGARVILIDPSHPREKACGGGLTGRALALVAPWHAADTVASVRITAARFTARDRSGGVVVPLGAGSGELVVSSRLHFDEALMQCAVEAGAQLVRSRVTAIESGPPHVVITRDRQQFSAPFVIGADGVNSVVRRTFTTPFGRDQLSIATGFYARGITSDEIVLEMVDSPAGYIWSFPRPDHLAIGICAQATDTSADALRHIVHTWIERTGLARGARLDAYSWPIPSLPAAAYQSIPIAGPGWFTVGDAAGLVDPITREGIYFALRSGLMAADAIGSGVAEPARVYESRVRDEIGGELAAAATLKAGFFRPEFSELMLDALETSPRIRAVMADLVAGTQPYRTLKRTLVGTLEIGLAWRWLTARQRIA